MTNDDMTLKPGQQLLGNEEAGLLQQTNTSTANSEAVTRQATTQQTIQAQAVKCPYCGATNDADSLYCASCGQVLRKQACPHCGSELDGDADFCETCHHYIKKEVCSFCGARLSAQDSFCPDCGSPRGGIVCPTCHTLNEFSFCKQCGRGLTEEAIMLREELKLQPEFQELTETAKEYNELFMMLPCETDEDKAVIRQCDELRQRVLRLLAQDAGVTNVVIPPMNAQRLSKKELDERKQEISDKITALLDKMALPPQPLPARARNYAMAQKPLGMRMAWLCNYKHAMHSSPCGCAKPQMGGKWVILGHSSKQEIKDDN